MALTVGQKKALVTALLFGGSEINGNAWFGLHKLGLVTNEPIEGKRTPRLTEAGKDTATQVLANRMNNMGVKFA